MNVLLIRIGKQTQMPSLQKHYHKSPYSSSIISVSEVAGPVFNRPLKRILKPIFAHKEFYLWLQWYCVCHWQSQDVLCHVWNLYISIVKPCLHSHDSTSKTEVLGCCRTILPCDIYIIDSVSELFYTLIIPKYNFCRVCQFQNKASFLDFACLVGWFGFFFP